jgi:cytochrome P450
MSDKARPDWAPGSEALGSDQIGVYDDMRRRCPVAYSERLQWSLFRHADVLRALKEPEGFSNVVSRHLSVPNGMDPPQHTAYRRVIEPYFGASRMRAFSPACRRIAAHLVKRLPIQGEVELMSEFAQEFGVQVQCAFLGWPADLHEALRQWARKNQEATVAGDRAAMAAVALEFDSHVRALLDARRRAGSQAPDDITTSLLGEAVGNRVLVDEEIVSILRNWTVGELGTIASCVGILAHYLAERPALQRQLREQPSLLPSAIDEILRIEAPLIANRRVATRPLEMGGRRIGAGGRITLMWASANRDEAAFGNPDEFRLDRDPTQNLLYGAGIHACPGAPLARMELRIVMEEILDGSRQIAPVANRPPVRATYPAGGFEAVPLWILRGEPSAAALT